jgi:L-asparaginase
MKKRVYIVYTGGTIGMTSTADGYAPVSGFLERQMADMRELTHRSMPEYTIHEYSPLLDSSNMTPAEWLLIAADIRDHYDQFDGFVVLHGTDTMAYTSSALAFMLDGLRKPVVVTGSQIPLCEVRSDARENLITSLIIAAEHAVPEVCLFFGAKLLRGCRAKKVHADGFDAFDSPNYPPLGIAGIDIDIQERFVRLPSSRSLEVAAMAQPVVGALRLFPGVSGQVTRNMLQPPLQGLVLEAYGVGNGPENNHGFLEALTDAVERGVVIVDCTQCLRGTVDLTGYATGSALARTGVISGYDMTAEAALAKLHYLFAIGLDAGEVRHQMQRDLRGELTLPE